VIARLRGRLLARREVRQVARDQQVYGALTITAPELRPVTSTYLRQATRLGHRQVMESIGRLTRAGLITAEWRTPPGGGLRRPYYSPKRSGS
jgi:hypothetical protein